MALTDVCRVDPTPFLSQSDLLSQPVSDLKLEIFIMLQIKSKVATGDLTDPLT